MKLRGARQARRLPSNGVERRHGSGAHLAGRRTPARRHARARWSYTWFVLPFVLAILLVLPLLLGTSALTNARTITTVPRPDAASATSPFGADGHAFGLSPSTGPHGADQVRELEHLLGRKVDLVNFYSGWAFPGFDTQALKTIEALRAVPEVTWEPWDYRLGMKQHKYALSRIIAGDFDRYIRSWAKAAAAWGQPFMLRFAQEMNGNWYPWGSKVNGNTPGEYVRAFRHIHKIFASVGATNVIWVWCPNVLYPGGPSLSSLYPGNAYVNWIGVDGYNWGTSLAHRGGWRSAATVFVPTLSALERLAPSKPIMIAETASAEQGGSKAAWITNLFKLLNRYPAVRAVAWFNYDETGPDWQITSSKSSIQAMAASLAKRWRR